MPRECTLRELKAAPLLNMYIIRWQNIRVGDGSACQVVQVGAVARLQAVIIESDTDRDLFFFVARESRPAKSIVPATRRPLI